MTAPLNPCIRVASPDAVSDLQDWLASDEAEALRLEGAKAERLSTDAHAIPSERSVRWQRLRDAVEDSLAGEAAGVDGVGVRSLGGPLWRRSRRGSPAAATQQWCGPDTARGSTAHTRH